MGTTNKKILSLDVGTVESGWCITDVSTLKPLQFGKDTNETIIDIINNNDFDYLVYEEFQSYGMPIGESTIKAITWNGRYIQLGLNKVDVVTPVFRKEVKMNFCNNMKAKDSNIRQALIDRFGVVGTKNNQGWFYGFKADIWSAYAIGITFIDTHIKTKERSKF